jgi:hypothetical protein
VPVERRAVMDSIVEARRILEEAAPRAAKVVLTEFTGQENLSIPELVSIALRKLSSIGSIRRKRDKLAIKAISWLMDQVPNTDPRKTGIVQDFKTLSVA